MSQPSAEHLDFAAFLAASVHDMKNSLGMLLGAMDELERCAAVCPRRDRVRQLQYEGRRLNGRLVELLVLYRMQAGTYAPNLAPHDVGECIEEVCLDHEGLLGARGVGVEHGGDEGVLWTFDRELVAGVIASTLNNAYRYARERVGVFAAVREGCLEIRVEDDGPGYPPAMLAGAEPRERPVDVRRGSSGLGIYFAELVARAHAREGRRGRVILANDGIDGGSCLTLILP